MFVFRQTTFATGFVADAGLCAQPSLAELAGGLLAGTKVATAMGWRDVAGVTEGDQVLTFDHGLQTVTAVTHELLALEGDLAARDNWLVQVPEGVLGNQEVLTLLPGQPVMIEADQAEELFGDPFAIVAASALDGYRGITRVPPMATTHIVVLTFNEDQVVFANTGGLLLCPASTDLYDAGTSAYQPLTETNSASLVNAMKFDPAPQGGYLVAA